MSYSVLAHGGAHRRCLFSVCAVDFPVQNGSIDWPGKRISRQLGRQKSCFNVLKSCFRVLTIAGVCIDLWTSCFLNKQYPLEIPFTRRLFRFKAHAADRTPDAFIRLKSQHSGLVGFSSQNHVLVAYNSRTTFSEPLCHYTLDSNLISPKQFQWSAHFFRVFPQPDWARVLRQLKPISSPIFVLAALPSIVRSSNPLASARMHRVFANFGWAVCRCLAHTVLHHS